MITDDEIRQLYIAELHGRIVYSRKCVRAWKKKIYEVSVGEYRPILGNLDHHSLDQLCTKHGISPTRTDCRKSMEDYCKGMIDLLSSISR